MGWVSLKIAKKGYGFGGWVFGGFGGLSCQNFGFDANKKTTSWWLNQPNLKKMSQIGSFPQVGVKITNL